MEKTAVKNFSAAHEGPPQGRDPLCSLCRTPGQSRWMYPDESCSPRRAQDPGSCCDPWMACAGAVHAEALYCTERTRAGAGEECAEEGVLKSDKLTTALIIHSFCTTRQKGERGIGRERVKLSQGM